MVNCKYCNRKLKNPDSIMRKCGKVCAIKNNVLEVKSRTKKEYKYMRLFEDVNC